MKKMLLLIFLICLIPLGCGPQIRVMQYDSVVRAPNLGRIDVYHSLSEVNRNYRIIADIKIKNTRIHKQDCREETKNMLISNAEKMGGDGVVINPFEQRSQTVSDGMGSKITEKFILGTANVIVYEEKLSQK
ncbi:MAG: hypothetical protein AB1921_06135 [Thermodesulfobacteriota bacterium]